MSGGLDMTGAVLIIDGAQINTTDPDRVGIDGLAAIARVTETWATDTNTMWPAPGRHTLTLISAIPDPIRWDAEVTLTAGRAVIMHGWAEDIAYDPITLHPPGAEPLECWRVDVTVADVIARAQATKLSAAPWPPEAAADRMDHIIAAAPQQFMTSSLTPNPLRPASKWVPSAWGEWDIEYPDDSKIMRYRDVDAFALTDALELTCQSTMWGMVEHPQGIAISSTRNAGAALMFVMADWVGGGYWWISPANMVDIPAAAIASNKRAVNRTSLTTTVSSSILVGSRMNDDGTLPQGDPDPKEPVDATDRMTNTARKTWAESSISLTSDRWTAGLYVDRSGSLPPKAWGSYVDMLAERDGRRVSADVAPSLGTVPVRLEVLDTDTIAALVAMPARSQALVRIADHPDDLDRWHLVAGGTWTLDGTDQTLTLDLIPAQAVGIRPLTCRELLDVKHDHYTRPTFSHIGTPSRSGIVRTISQFSGVTISGLGHLRFGAVMQGNPSGRMTVKMLGVVGVLT